MYCPKCKSRLGAGDADYMKAVGICSYCVTYDNTPGRRFMAAYLEYIDKKKKPKKENKRFLMLYV